MHPHPQGVLHARHEGPVRWTSPREIETFLQDLTATSRKGTPEEELRVNEYVRRQLDKRDARDIGADERALMKELHGNLTRHRVCLGCGKDYTIAGTLGYFVCRRHVGPHGFQRWVRSTHHETFTPAVLPPVPILLFFTTLLRIPADAEAVDAVNLKTLPDGSVDLVRTTVSFRSILPDDIS